MGDEHANLLLVALCFAPALEAASFTSRSIFFLGSAVIVRHHERATRAEPLVKGRTRMDRLIVAAIEAVVLTMAAGFPWCYAGAMPGSELILSGALALLLVLWALRMIASWRVAWEACPLALCLAGLFLLGVVQLIPLSPSSLRMLSPSAAELYDALLPTAREVLPFGQTIEPTTSPPGSTLSLYPGATRQELLRLLWVLVLYVVVRSNLNSTAHFRRLAWTSVVSGLLVSVFAFVQYFTSTPGMVFWTHQTAGAAFGPFVNRNHFAFYTNLCLGLALGLYLGRAGAKRTSVAGPQSVWSSWFASLEDPARLWLSVAMALMASAVCFCLSRGGLISLAIAAGLGLVLAIYQGRFVTRALPASAVVAALALLIWFGTERIERRISTLWKPELAADSRWPLWRSGLELALDFPLWGTGYGTFSTVEPMKRTNRIQSRLVAAHADNDYLEALVEGGLVRLVLSLVAIGVVLRLGWRTVKLSEDSMRRGLAAGAMIGFAAIVLQSFVDFGLHLPAIAILSTLVAAHLCMLDRPATVPLNRTQKKRLAKSFRPWPACGAVAAVGLAVVLVKTSLVAHEAQELRFAAQNASGAMQDRVPQLEQAGRLESDNAQLELELAVAHLEAFQIERTRPVAEQKPVITPEGWAALEKFGLDTIVKEAEQAPATPETAAARADAQARFDHLLPALQAAILARDDCPLLPGPHLWLALNAAAMDRADSQSTYLARAKLLAPADADLWYVCGVQEILAADQLESAWQSWRRSLELSDGHLADILDRSSGLLSTRELMERVLPDRAAVWLAAAAYRYPVGAKADERAPLDETSRRLMLERGLAMMPPGSSSTADDLRLRAHFEAALGDNNEAISALRLALFQEPGRLDWRMELAKLLGANGHSTEALNEVKIVLAHYPTLAEARNLANELTAKIARGN